MISHPGQTPISITTSPGCLLFESCDDHTFLTIRDFETRKLGTPVKNSPCDAFQPSFSLRTVLQTCCRILRRGRARSNTPKVHCFRSNRTCTTLSPSRSISGGGMCAARVIKLAAHDSNFCPLFSSSFSLRVRPMSH